MGGHATQQEVLLLERSTTDSVRYPKQTATCEPHLIRHREGRPLVICIRFPKIDKRKAKRTIRQLLESSQFIQPSHGKSTTQQIFRWNEDDGTFLPMSCLSRYNSGEINAYLSYIVTLCRRTHSQRKNQWCLSVSFQRKISDLSTYPSHTHSTKYKTTQRSRNPATIGIFTYPHQLSKENSR